MKIRFNRMLSIICAVMLLISAASVWAAAEGNPASPTDLSPAGTEEQKTETGTEPAEETADETVASIEVVITKTMAINQSWEGKMGKTKPAVLKLDLDKPGTVYMLVEGMDIWATVEKSDRVTENPTRTETDPETGRMIVSWEAEAGSYLITLGPVEPNLLAMGTVTFMDKQKYLEWEETLEETEPEPVEEEAGPEGEPEETGPESENEERVPDENPDRKVKVSLTWDVGYPILGDTAHLGATLEGYEELNYTLQWQSSPDKETWSDVQDANDLLLDVVITEENNHYYWRLVVYLEDEEEA